ncbi:hypothetical protein [Aliirhizobium cellulosilyticum]|uniref:Uncharacterized protein n=1 Tax=Aliirhizobium cellulosilyticum TaxID=393664 RepID=A0A7W6TF80_9HYPH|nr:hypothetical protein [Rhizobium cellulosilyticum]MBB4349413.1 hypothetical protein [Rhizobium cellulosilyticum]MBB4412365.1 hypothetical protein [Rhizobium cellulosilyticum]MBB4446997.1 hypothetical protein [Rhizobium cellulosilyticum]
MLFRNGRAEFLETLHTVCEAQENLIDCNQVIWKTEYLTKMHRHYHYYGIGRGGHTSMAGHELNDREGINRGADPENMLFVMLDFERNREIIPYLGQWTKARDILRNLDVSDDEAPEVVRLSMEKRGQTHRGQKLVVVTDVAYIGFRMSAPRSVHASLAQMPEISPQWCRDRHFISGQAATARQTEWMPTR